MTVIDQVRDDISASGSGLIWSGALVAALGDPKDWEYKGECFEDNSHHAACSCGHPIVYVFPIYHRVTGAMKPLGSTCIEYFSQAGDIYAGLVAGLAKLETRLAEAKKAAKRAQDEVKVDAARTEYETAHTAMRDSFQAYRERGQMAPRALWQAVESSYYRIPSRCPEYQRPCDYLKWYAKQTKAVNFAMGVPAV